MNKRKLLPIIGFVVVALFALAFTTCEDGSGETREMPVRKPIPNIECRTCDRLPASCTCAKCTICGDKPCQCPCGICDAWPHLADCAGFPDNELGIEHITGSGFRTGVDRAPNDEVAWFFSGRAPSTAIVEFMIGENEGFSLVNAADRSAANYDYLVFEITADSHSMFDWIAGLYPRLGTNPENLAADDTSVRVSHNGPLRSIIDGSRGSFDGEWYTLSIPISMRAGWLLHNDNGAGPAGTIKGIQLEFVFRSGYDGPADERLYFKGFRLETDPTLENASPVGGQGKQPPSIATPTNTIPGYPIGDYKIVHQQHRAHWGIVMAPDGITPAYYAANALADNGHYDYEFPSDGSNTSNNINFISGPVAQSSATYFVFDVHADTMELLNAIEGFRLRFRRPDQGWPHIDFNAFPSFSEGRTALGGTPGWITIRVNIREPHMETNGTVTDIMSNVKQFWPRPFFSQAFRNDPDPDSKLYFANFRLE